MAMNESSQSLFSVVLPGSALTSCGDGSFCLKSNEQLKNETQPCVLIKNIDITQKEPPISLCCVCGISTQPNGFGLCPECMKEDKSFRVLDKIDKNFTLSKCNQCGRFKYMNKYMFFEPESHHLLALCLKKVKILQKLNVVDASFVWTEPHSNTLRVMVKISNQISNRSMIEEACEFFYKIVSNQCPDCKRSWTPHTWTSLVQLRQRCNHKRTLLYLEQLLIKNKFSHMISGVKEVIDGMDLEFQSRSDAAKVVEFVSSQFTAKVSHSKQLVSHDASSNTCVNKYTTLCLVSPISRDDLVYVEAPIRALYGGINSLLLCTKASTITKLIDPLKGEGHGTLSVPAEKFWRNPFFPLLTREHLTELMVIDVNKEPTEKGDIYYVEVQRACTYGNAEETVIVRSHLGPLLHPGDCCLGYDYRYVNVSGLDQEKIAAYVRLTDVEVILVRKANRKNKSERNWELSQLKRSMNDMKIQTEEEKRRKGRDVELLKQDIEDCPEVRSNVNLYRKYRRKRPLQVKKPDVVSNTKDSDAPETVSDCESVADLLDSLDLNANSSLMNY